MIRLLLLLSTSSMLLTTCRKSPESPLPYLGFHDVQGTDTLYHQIPDFSFLNQDSIMVSNLELQQGIYVADFFYSNCPTICPKVKHQMLKIYDQYEQEDHLKLVSFALDPQTDNVEHLHFYANNLGVSSKRWHFLTGDKDRIWELSEQYLISVKADEEEPGGIFHSGKIILIDQQGHVRSFAEGTDPQKVEELMQDIDQLLQEIERRKN